VIAGLLAALALLVGHPVELRCDGDTPPPGLTIPPGAVLEGWTQLGGDVLHLSEARCAGLRRPGRGREWAWSVQTLLHEGAHAAGVRREDCAESLATVWFLFAAWRLRLDWAETLAVLEEFARRSATRPEPYRPRDGSCVELL
jgi:hypothetical protein